MAFPPHQGGSQHYGGAQLWNGGSGSWRPGGPPPPGAPVLPQLPPMPQMPGQPPAMYSPPQGHLPMQYGTPPPGMSPARGQVRPPPRPLLAPRPLLPGVVAGKRAPAPLPSLPVRQNPGSVPAPVPRKRRPTHADMLERTVKYLVASQLSKHLSSKHHFNNNMTEFRKTCDHLIERILQGEKKRDPECYKTPLMQTHVLSTVNNYMRKYGTAKTEKLRKRKHTDIDVCLTDMAPHVAPLLQANRSTQQEPLTHTLCIQRNSRHHHHPPHPPTTNRSLRAHPSWRLSPRRTKRRHPRRRACPQGQGQASGWGWGMTPWGPQMPEPTPHLPRRTHPTPARAAASAWRFRTPRSCRSRSVGLLWTTASPKKTSWVRTTGPPRPTSQMSLRTGRPPGAPLLPQRRPRLTGSRAWRNQHPLEQRLRNSTATAPASPHGGVAFVRCPAIRVTGEGV